EAVRRNQKENLSMKWITREHVKVDRVACPWLIKKFVDKDAERRYTRCTIPDQSGDPSALTILTLTFATGYTDRFGRSGDVDYRLTMGVQNNAWKITGVCDILSEGCFAVSWG